MKAFLGILTLLSLVNFSVSCNRDVNRSDQMQREETIRGDDIRDRGMEDRTVPVDEDQMNLEDRETPMGPNESSVTE